VSSERNLVDLRLPVQYVVRGESEFRGFAGTLASGIVRTGDEISIWPSAERTRVASISSAGARVDEAFAPMSAVLTLEDARDVGRGDMITHVRNVPRLERDIDAMLVWMDEEPLRVGRRYLVKHATRTIPGVVAEVLYAVDVNTLRRLQVDVLEKNAVGRARLTLTRTIPCDTYKENRGTGAFILIDPVSNRTSAAGMILDREHRSAADTVNGAVAEWTGPAPESRVTVHERLARLHQTPFTVLLTGLAGAGKTTIAQALERRLFDAGYHVVLLDGRVLRETISRRLGFSTPERTENLSRAMGVAQILNNTGIICICALEAPTRDARQRARTRVGRDRFVEIYVSTPLEVCRQRDTDDLYARADAGEIELPGVTGPYEPPLDPDLEISAEALNVESCVDRVVQVLDRRRFLR
jgi:bifunctional enzyme CysN/CysC